MNVYLGCSSVKVEVAMLLVLDDDFNNYVMKKKKLLIQDTHFWSGSEANSVETNF